MSLGTGLAATNVLRESFADYNRDAPKVLITSKEERRIGASSLTPCFYLRVEHPTTEREAEIVGLRTPNSGREFHAGMAGRAKALYVTVSMP